MKPERTQFTQTTRSHNSVAPVYEYVTTVKAGSAEAAAELSQVIWQNFLNHTAKASPAGIHEISLRLEPSQVFFKLTSSNNESLEAVIDAVELWMKPQRTP